MASDWLIEHWPRCGFHAFLSHVAGDRDSLVVPVLQGLERGGLASWLDAHHYPTGRDSHEALRESMLCCRHIVYFITPALLKQGRGWTAIESAYADLVHRQLALPSSALMQFELPLFFVDRDHRSLTRSAWRRLSDRGAFFRPRTKKTTSGSRETDQINWAIDEITRFVRREENQSESVADRLQHDVALTERFARNPNLRDRLLGLAPVKLTSR